MKRKISSVFFALVLALSLSLVTAVPVAAQQPNEVWVDDDFTETTAGWEETNFDTIQAGINAVALDGTVNVADGDYNATTLNSTQDPLNTGWWWFVTINKSLDLIGESRDGVILDGTALQGEVRSTGIWVSASNVTVKNLTIQNFKITAEPDTACYGLYVMEKFRDYTWENVALLQYVTAENIKAANNTCPIYFMKTEYATVKDCVVDNNTDDGIWVAWGSDYATVQGNMVTNSGDHGIWVGQSWMGQGHGSNNATIINNTINGAREAGISFVASAGAIISGNTITNAAAEHSSVGGWSVGALSLKDSPSNVEAFNNNIYNNDGSWDGHNGTGHGVGIDGTPSNINLYLNNIYNNSGDGFHNYSTVAVNAINNWWGDPTGPAGEGLGTGDEVTTYVNYQPWLVGLGAYAWIDTNLNGAVNPGESHFASIQDAIVAALSGDTIIVAVGTYTEDLVVGEQLTLEGAQAGVDPTEEGARTVPAEESTVIGAHTITASDVIVDGFTFDGGITLDDLVNLISGGTISNNIITGAENGIRVGFDHNGKGVDGVKIENNTIINSLFKGIRFSNTKLDFNDPHDPQRISNITISGNEIRGNGSAGMETYGPGPNRIINNSISGNGGNGINLKFDDGDVVTGNIITNNDGPGITLRQVTNTVVENNSMSGHQSLEVFNEFESGGGEGSKGSGIHIVFASENNTIRFNDISGNNYGIFIHRGKATDKGQPSGNSINFNNIYGNINYGILNALVDPPAPVDATNNWWGTKVESDIALMVSGDVVYDPWIGAGVEDSMSEKTGTDEVVTVNAKDEAGTEVVKTGSGTPTITVTEYTANPGDGAPGGFTSVGKYIDVHIDDKTGVDEIEIKNYYTLADIAGLNLDENSLRLSWWNGTDWIECSHSAATLLEDDPTYRGFVWAKIRIDTTPDLDNLAGTPFMSMGTPVVAPTPPPVAGGGGGGPPPVPTGTTDVRGMVSTAGVFFRDKTIISEDRLCTLTIPKGTVGLTEELEPLTQISMLIMDEPPPPPEEGNVIGLACDFQPSGASFDPSITLTFSYDPADIPEGIAEGDLVLAFYDEATGEWIELEGCVVDPETNTITASLSHFTAFVVAFIPAPAAFIITGLEVAPAEVEIGDMITIRVLIENTGEMKGISTVALKINGEVEQSKYVVLGSGASQTVSFAISRDVAGSYSVEINGLTGSFTIKAPPELAPAPAPPPPPTPVPPTPVPPAEPINWPLIGGVIAVGVVLAGLSIFFLIRRRAV